MFGQCQPNVVDGLVSWREVPGGDRTGAGKACGGGAPAPRRRKFSKIALASPSEFPYSTFSHGGVAQLGERLTGSQEVRGSIPLVSTRALNEAPTQVGAFFHIGNKVKGGTMILLVDKIVR